MKAVVQGEEGGEPWIDGGFGSRHCRKGKACTRTDCAFAHPASWTFHRRIDPSDGGSYTRAEFLAFYGGLQQWNAAAPSHKRSGQARVNEHVSKTPHHAQNYYAGVASSSVSSSSTTARIPNYYGGAVESSAVSSVPNYYAGIGNRARTGASLTSTAAPAAAAAQSFSSSQAYLEPVQGIDASMAQEMEDIERMLEAEMMAGLPEGMTLQELDEVEAAFEKSAGNARYESQLPPGSPNSPTTPDSPRNHQN